MNDEQKQIEEMAKVISPYYDFCKITKCENCNRKKLSKCRYYSFAKRCVMNGYRKQSDTAREILKPLYDCIIEHSNCCVNLSEDIKFLIEKYSVEVEE